jgi:hypothetical protein
MPPRKKAKQTTIKDVAVYSYSKLETYNRCSMQYKHQYVDKVSGVDTSSLATVIGSKCHEALEVFYLNPDCPSPYDALLANWKRELEEDGLEALYTDLNHYASDISRLSHRASSSYGGKDAIRTSTGTVPKSPEMTAEWKKAVRELKLDERAGRIDRLAAQVQPRKWIAISLADTFAHSCSIMFGYKNPKDIAEVLLVEMPISSVNVVAADPNDPTIKLKDEDGNYIKTLRGRGKFRPWYDDKRQPEVLGVDNKVTFPLVDENDELVVGSEGEVEYPDDNVMFNGFIDLICRTSDGKLAIIDHKTSKGDAPAMSEVARHNQLLMYGWAVWRLTGEVPDFIGVNHLRTNKLVLAKFNLDLAIDVVKNKMGTIKGINAKVFIKQDPNGYGSMCITQSSKGPTYCPYFSLCHKDLLPNM